MQTTLLVKKQKQKRKVNITGKRMSLSSYHPHKCSKIAFVNREASFYLLRMSQKMGWGGSGIYWCPEFSFVLSQTETAFLSLSLPTRDCNPGRIFQS